MLDLARDLRLPTRKEYEPFARYLEGLRPEEARQALREAVRQDRYILAVLLGYDDEEHRWDDIHLWMIRKRIPELRATPGCQSAWFCPRGTFKTALEEVDLTYSCLVDPNRTYGVGSWKLDVAARITRAVQRNLQNQVLVWLFPDVLWEPGKAEDKWTETEFTVRRTTAAKDATVTAFALEAPATSLHFDRIHLDDVVERRNSSTEYQIDKVKQTLRDVRSLRVGPASQIEVRGTLWDPDDWHCSVILQGKDWVIERHPAIVEDPKEAGAAPCPVPRSPGEALFPSVKPLEVLAQDEREMGSWHFGCQMLLKVESVGDARWVPVSPGEYFDLDDLPARYEVGLFVDLATEDPKFEKADDLAVGAFAAGPPGPGYSLFVLEGRAQASWNWVDAAEYLYALHERWGGAVWIEEIGAFKSFERVLLEVGRAKGLVLGHKTIPREPGSGGAIKERLKNLDSWFEQRRVKSRNPNALAAEEAAFFLTYERQRARWPRVSHDDVLDLIEAAAKRLMPPKERTVSATSTARPAVARAR